MKRASLIKLIALSGVPLIMVLGNSMLIPVFPQMQQALGISKLQVGLTITLFSLPAGLAIPIMGFLSDKIGRKRIIVPALIVYGLGGLVSGLAPLYFNKSFTLLLLGRIIQGLGAAGTAPIAMALVSDIFTSNERSKALGSIEAANGLGKVVSPILGSLIALIIWYALFFVYALLAIPIALAVWLLIKEPPLKSMDQSLGNYLRNISKIFRERGKALLACYLAGSVVLLVLFGVLSYLSDFLEETYGFKGVIKGFALAVPVLAMSLTSFFSGKYLQKHQNLMKAFIICGLFTVSGSLATLSLVNSNLIFFAGVFLMGIGTGLVLPAVNTLVTSSCKLEERGGITALYGSVRFFGVAAGPPSFSLLLSLSKTMMFLGAGVLAAVAGVLGFVLINEKQLLKSTAQDKKATNKQTVKQFVTSAKAGSRGRGDKFPPVEFAGSIKRSEASAWNAFVGALSPTLSKKKQK